MINIDFAIHCCCEDVCLIENYEQAVNDCEKTWELHHRCQILPCGVFSRDQLKKHNLYYYRPACELIFLTKTEHRKLHHTTSLFQQFHWKPGNIPWNKNTKGICTAWNKGKTGIYSSETLKKISNSNKGKTPVNKGTKLSDYEKHQISIKTKNAMKNVPKEKLAYWKGKKHEIKSLQGRKWWNDGNSEIRTHECPGEKWKRGRLKK